MTWMLPHRSETLNLTLENIQVGSMSGFMRGEMFRLHDEGQHAAAASHAEELSYFRPESLWFFLHPLTFDYVMSSNCSCWNLIVQSCSAFVAAHTQSDSKLMRHPVMWHWVLVFISSCSNDYRWLHLSNAAWQQKKSKLKVRTNLSLFFEHNKTFVILKNKKSWKGYRSRKINIHKSLV